MGEPRKSQWWSKMPGVCIPAALRCYRVEAIRMVEQGVVSPKRHRQRDGLGYKFPVGPLESD